MQGTWYFYLLALAIGAVVSMFMLALLKRPIKK
jgi:fructose-specific phosphotransferase system IIC component